MQDLRELRERHVDRGGEFARVDAAIVCEDVEVEGTGALENASHGGVILRKGGECRHYSTFRSSFDRFLVGF